MLAVFMRAVGTVRALVARTAVVVAMRAEVVAAGVVKVVDCAACVLEQIRCHIRAQRKRNIFLKYLFELFKRFQIIASAYLAHGVLQKCCNLIQIKFFVSSKSHFLSPLLHWRWRRHYTFVTSATDMVPFRSKPRRANKESNCGGIVKSTMHH